MSDEQEAKEIIKRLSAIMASSIAELCLPCIEQRCNQFLSLMHEQGALGKPDDKPPQELIDAFHSGYYAGARNGNDISKQTAACHDYFETQKIMRKVLEK